MSQHAHGRIEIDPYDTLPDILLRVKASRDDALVIGIPETSNLFVTAAEFRTLKSTADQVRVNVSIETNDKLRIQLATMFGIEAHPLNSEEQAKIQEEHPSWPTAEWRTGQNRIPVPAGDLATSKPWKDEAIDASSGISVPPKPVARPEYALEPRTGAIGKQEADARARTKPGAIVSILLGIVAALLLAGFLSVFLRTGEIVVSTPRMAVSQSMTFGYSTDGSQVPGASMTLPAVQTEFTIPFTATYQATGTLANSGGKATGAVQLRNISGSAVTLSAGTELSVSGGPAFVLDSEVTLPTGDAENPGKSQGTVTAVESGSAGNVAAGTFTGAVSAFPGVYFSNQDAAFAGGTDVTIAVVTEEDLANARANAISELDNMAGSYQLPDGQVVIPSTVSIVHEASVEADHVAGDQVDQFSVSAQATYQGLTLNPSDLPDAIEDQIRAQISQSVPEGYVLTDEDIKFGNPAEGPPGSSMITVDASIDAYQALTGDMVQAIRAATTGKTPEEATAALAAIPEIEVQSVSVSPNLIIKTLPAADKIEVKAQ